MVFEAKRVVGIDPGTKSFDVVCVEGSRVVYEKSIDTVELVKKPELLIDAVNEANADYVVAPSGYGVPVTRGDEVFDAEKFTIEILLLSSEEDIRRGFELGEIGAQVYVAMAKLAKHIVGSYGSRVFFIPSIVLLPTIPFYRKLNKIDMGTADKLAATFIAIHTFAKDKGIDYSDVNIIVAELGYGYNAAIAVENGEIVDAVGGTTASIGTLTAGSLDLEIVAHAGKWERWDVFYGGIFHFAKAYDLNIFVKAYENSEEPLASLFTSFVEGIAKDIAKVKTVFKSPRKVETIVLTGRHSKVPLVVKLLREYLPDMEIRPCGMLEGASISKEAGQGYAAIGEGLAGGYFSKLVKHMGIDKACGTVVDYVAHPRAEEFKNNLVKRYKELVKNPRLCK